MIMGMQGVDYETERPNYRNYYRTGESLMPSEAGGREAVAQITRRDGRTRREEVPDGGNSW